MDRKTARKNNVKNRLQRLKNLRNTDAPLWIIKSNQNRSRYSWIVKDVNTTASVLPHHSFKLNFTRNMYNLYLKIHKGII